VILGLIFAASGCGGGTSTIKTPATVTQASNAPQPAVAAPVRHLSIVSPRAGAHTAATLTVRVKLTGTATNGAQPFRYVLDRRVTRSGSDGLTFHNLAPGRHRLEVIWPSASPSHVATTFIVRAPARVVVPVPAQAQPAASTPILPPSTSPPPRTSPPTKTTTAPASPQASPPQSNGGIPQGPNAGDGDGDNNGGPSDGDGNL
jgi:hypothetical protein